MSGSALRPAAPFVVDLLLLAEIAEFIDCSGVAGVSVPQQRKRKLGECAGRNVNPEFVVAVAPSLFYVFTGVLGVDLIDPSGLTVKRMDLAIVPSWR